MALKVSQSRVIKDALAYPPGEAFEASLGRSVRRHGGSYDNYLEIVTRLREVSRERGVSLRDAAASLADQP